VGLFLGGKFEETADALGVPATEAKRSYQRARLWLENKLKEFNLDA
jgi:hypothetical protein